jgi:hypothetical protein
MPGTQDTERQLHQQFASVRVRKNNEWFSASQDLLAFIDALKERAA